MALLSIVSDPKLNGSVGTIAAKLDESVFECSDQRQHMDRCSLYDQSIYGQSVGQSRARSSTTVLWAPAQTQQR